MHENSTAKNHAITFEIHTHTHLYISVVAEKLIEFCAFVLSTSGFEAFQLTFMDPSPLFARCLFFISICCSFNLF